MYVCNTDNTAILQPGQPLAEPDIPEVRCGDVTTTAAAETTPTMPDGNTPPFPEDAHDTCPPCPENTTVCLNTDENHGAVKMLSQEQRQPTWPSR